MPRSYVVKMSHRDRAERRRGMVEAVRSGSTVADVAQRFGVTETTVRSACFTANVSIGDPPGTLSRSTYAVVAALSNTGDKLIDLALRFGLSESRVNNIYRECVRAGVPVKTRGRGRPKK